jgi:hypothetical protein
VVGGLAERTAAEAEADEMKLFKVTYSFDVLVIADDEDSAREIADDNAEDEFGNMSPRDCFETISEILREAQIPNPWRDGLVYGVGDDEEEMTATTALQRIIAERRPADLPGQGKLF